MADITFPENAKPLQKLHIAVNEMKKLKTFTRDEEKELLGYLINDIDITDEDAVALIEKHFTIV